VSAEPGTTRDYLEEPVALGPHCIRLIDTAGLNPSPTPLERRGMAHTLARAAEADLVAARARRHPPGADPAAGGRGAADAGDRPGGRQQDRSARPGRGPTLPPGLPVVRISALTGAGVDELVAAIVRHAESFRQEQGDELVAIKRAPCHGAARSEGTSLRRHGETVRKESGRIARQ